MTDAPAMDIQAIQKILPHRYPFLLVDRVLELENNVRGVAIKNVSMNEPFFQGHFPDMPVMPGVLIVESLAQLSGIVASDDALGGERTGFFAAINHARFRQPVVPGDQLRLEADILKRKSGVVKVSCRATVDGAPVCEAELTISFR